MTTQEIIEVIKGLSVLELNDLVKACEEEFGVSAAAGVVVAAAGAAEAAEEVKDAAVKEVEPKAEKAVEADIKEVAAAAKETVKDTGAKVVDKAKEVTKKVEKTVKEKVAEVKAAAADPEVYVQYQGNESNLAVITERIKKQYVEEGHFAPGSMLPKVQAALDFAESKPGRQSLITLLEKAKDGILGETGTRIHL